MSRVMRNDTNHFWAKDGYDNDEPGLDPPASVYDAGSPKVGRRNLTPPPPLPLRLQDTDKPIRLLPVAKGQKDKTDIDAVQEMPYTSKAADCRTPSPNFAAVSLPSSSSSQGQFQRFGFETSPDLQINICMSQKRGSTLPSDIESSAKKRRLHDSIHPGAATWPQKLTALKAVATPNRTAASAAIGIDDYQDSPATDTCSTHPEDIEAWTQTHFGDESVKQLSSEGDRGVIGDVLVNNMLDFGISFCAEAETYPCGGPYLQSPPSIASAGRRATEGAVSERTNSEHLIRTDPKFFPETKRMILIVLMPGGVGHWVLVEVQHIARKVIVRDSLSMYTANSPKLRTVITNYTKACLWDTSSEARDWVWETVSCPQQENGIDCGVFAIVMALHLCANHEIPDSFDASVWRRVLLALAQAKPLLSCIRLPDKDADMAYGVGQSQDVANPGDNGEGTAYVIATIQRLTESLKQDFFQHERLTKRALSQMDEVIAAILVLQGLDNKASNEQRRLDEAIARLSKEELDMRATCDTMKAWRTADDQDKLVWTGRIEDHIQRIMQARRRHKARRDILSRASEMISRLDIGQALGAIQQAHRKASERVERVRLELACCIGRVVQDLGLEPEMETVWRGKHTEISKRIGQ